MKLCKGGVALQVRFESKPSEWAAEAARIASQEAAQQVLRDKQRQLQQAQEAQAVGFSHDTGWPHFGMS